MSRNGSGTFSIPNTLVSGTPITAAAHNQNYADIGSEITNSLALDGQSTMTGPLKAANGSAAIPSYAFGSDTNTGAYRSASGEYSVAADGVQITAVNADGLDIKSGTLSIAGTEVFPVPTAQIADKSVTLQKLYHPSAPAVLLGSNSNPALTITGAANNGSGLIRLTVADTSTFATSQKKTVSDVLGTTEANGTWTITVVDSTHIDLQGSAFANAYVSGGTIGGAVEEITVGTGLSLTGSTLSAPLLTPQGYLFGLTLSNGTDTVNDINISAGKCRDELDTATIVLTAITKQLDSAWAAGTNAGGRSSASLADGTWHVFAIAKADGTADVLFHTALDPTSVLPSGYTVYRRIGSIVRSTTILQFSQFGDEFLLTTAVTDSFVVPTSAAFRTVTVPLGIKVYAKMRVGFSSLINSGGSVRVSSPDEGDAAPNSGVSDVLASATTYANAATLAVRTNTSAQVRVIGGSATNTYIIGSYGWVDHRGRLA